MQTETVCQSIRRRSLRCTPRRRHQSRRSWSRRARTARTLVDLRQPDTVYTAPLFGDGHPAQNGDTPGESAHDGATATLELAPPLEQALASPAPSTASAPEAPIGAAPIDSGEPPGAETDSTTSEDRANDDRPMVDFALLVPLKESAEYQALGKRLASPEPVDSWREDGLHFFVFELLRDDGAGAVPPAAEAPVVIFTMHPEETAPVSGVMVTPIPGGEQAEVVDLRQPDSGYTAHLAPWRRQ